MLEQTPGVEIRVSDDIDALIAAVSGQSAGGDHVLVMSNSGFEGFHQRLLDALAERQR
jgi:UDP-N-acetylmuramate: L-alanyl-gamma-D-glutamyl-meso-diaminopimelate ligase